MPNFHWPKTSIQEFTWNSKSCPEGLPRKKNGRITRNAVAITMRRGRGKMWFPTIPTGSSCGVVCVRSREDEFRREWPPQLICLHSDCCLSCLNEQSGGFAINELW